MAINPDNITTIRVDQLANEPITSTSLLAHQVGTELKQDTVQSLIDLVATAIGAGSGVGYLPISVTDGQQLPDVPTDPSFFLAGIGTYLNVNGYPDIICTEELNAIMNVVDHWEIAVEIPIEPLSGSVQSVTGSAVDNTDPLNPIVDLPVIPPFVPSDYDLEDFTNAGADPYAHVSEIPDTPTLQEVTDAGNTTTNPIIVTDGLGVVSAFTGALVVSTTFDDAYTDIGAGYIGVSNEDGLKSVELEQDTIKFLNNVLNISTTIIPKTGGTIGGVLELPDASGDFLITTPKTADFEAVNGVYYIVNTGVSEVTDPTGVTNKGYIVHVIGGTPTIGGIAYSSGDLIYRYYNGTSWITTNMNTVVDATPTDGSTNAVSSNGVFDALALKTDKSRTIYQGAASVTGVAVQTLLATMKIDANTYASNDAFSFKMSIQKGVTASTVEYRVWLGTTSGALTTQIGRIIINAATRTADFYREYYINSGNLDTSISFTSSALSGIAQTTTVNTPVAVTMSNDLWISITATPTNVADVNGIMGASITPLK
jgi:hypothetical protein